MEIKITSTVSLQDNQVHCVAIGGMNLHTGFVHLKEVVLTGSDKIVGAEHLSDFDRTLLTAELNRFVHGQK